MNNEMFYIDKNGNKSDKNIHNDILGEDEFDVGKINNKKFIDELYRISKTYPIEEKFVWGIPENCPISIPKNINSNFEKNIYLKENLHQCLKDVSFENYYWIIQQWGGIKSLKENQRNNEKLKKFKKQIEAGKLTKETFGLISSFSKVASFLYPEKFAIYDSRVIYSLNWLIFRYSSKKLFFPQPVGRSASLSKYDMQTIFRLSKIEYQYHPEQVSFFEYCTLLSELSKIIYGSEKPYYVEMLLFLIAPEYIVKDIEKSITLERYNRRDRIIWTMRDIELGEKIELNK